MSDAEYIPSSILGSSSLSDHRSGRVNSYARVPGAIYARVISVNWAARTVDCIGLHNQTGAGPWYGVPIISSVFSQTEGQHWLPTITEPTGSSPQTNAKLEGKGDGLAILDFIYGDPLNPVCLGFISPGANQFSFSEPGTKITRHASNVYDRLTANGTYEFAFPDGTFLKIAPASEGYGLTNLDAKNTRNADTHPWSIPVDAPRIVSFSHPSGTSITIDQNGAINITSASSISITSQTGSVSLRSRSDSFTID